MMQNQSYYHAAYAVALAIYLLYSGSLWWRSRDLDRREAAVDEAERRSGAAR
ncbi:MAG: hypothetical protein ACYC2G_04540 [Gemmatimonadaceae bacterium]